MPNRFLSFQHRALALPALIAFALILASSALAGLTPADVLVIYNKDVSESRGVADTYLALRNIPKDNLVEISAPKDEEISRAEYNEKILAPVKEALKKHESALALVAVYGVPLKIRETTFDDDGEAFTGRDHASVDSELCLALTPQTPAAVAAFNNPYFNKEEPFNRTFGILIVCRLDGPTAAIAKSMAEKAVLAEVMGAEGESFLDTGVERSELDGRDKDMKAVEDSWKALGIAYVHDKDKKVADLSQRGDTLHYQAWYAGGPEWKAKPRFRTGAIAVHLHSFAASTIRDVKQNWVAPLLNAGATCSIGTVYEPYTAGFPEEKVFWDRIAKGYSFGEAGWMANQVISWQSVFLGDPLYTPYPKNFKERKAAARAAVLEKLGVVPDKAKPGKPGDKPAGGDKPADKPAGDKADKPEGDADKAEKPAEEPAPADFEKVSDELIAAAVKLISSRVDAVVSANKKGAEEAAMSAYAANMFDLRDFGLEKLISTKLAPLNALFKKKWDTIKKAVKANPLDTADFEAALGDWKGLDVWKEVKAYEDDVQKAHAKGADTAIKAARKGVKEKRYLDAWKSAREVEKWKFAKEFVSEAKLIKSELENGAESADKLKAQADMALAPIRQKAFEAAQKGDLDGQEKVVRQAIADYPDCTERRKCQELLAAILDAKAKKKG
jgi:uncharacterized protein (TIGR03790 family)